MHYHPKLTKIYLKKKKKTSGTAEPLLLENKWILYIEQIQEYNYLVKVLLIGDSAIGNLNFYPYLLGMRSSYSGLLLYIYTHFCMFCFIYLYTYLYVLCNLDLGCLYIYACVYNNFFFFFGENCAYNLDMGFFFKKSFNLIFLYVTICIALIFFFLFGDNRI